MAPAGSHALTEGVPPSGPTLVLLGAPECHLCHAMREAILPLLHARGLRLLERDVRENEEWERRYLLEVPVLLFGDVELARHRVDVDSLSARLLELGF